MPEPVSNQGPPDDRPVVVRDHVGVDLLLNLTATRRLAPFMRRDHTLGTAAKELALPASTLSYWVDRFVCAGLVEVVRHEPRAGKAIPWYRATTSEFRVPLDAMPPGQRDQLLHGGRRHIFDEYSNAVDRLVTTYLDRGLRIKSHPDRGVELNFVEDDSPVDMPVSEFWGSFALTADEAAEVRHLIERIKDRLLAARSGPGRKDHVVVMGITPAPRRR